MHHTTAEGKLNNIGEHGIGEHVLVIACTKNKLTDLIFKEYIDRKWKLRYFTYDLNADIDQISARLVHTINYCSYVKNFIIDYPTLLLIVENLRRTSLLNSILKKLVVFNPVRAENIEGMFSSKYQNIFDQTVNLRDLNDEKYLLSHLHYLKSHDALILAKQDKAFGLKLASHLKNSELEVVEGHTDVIAKISHYFR